MNKITNNDVIKEWSDVPQEVVKKMGDLGDFGRQYLLNPVFFQLLGDVNGMRILDAGCGQEYLSRLLAKKGAVVTGIEPAGGLIAYAQKRENEEKLGITYVKEDLSSWKPEPGRFDIVLSNMVFMDIPNYKSAIHNCIYSLKANGKFIFSISHPCFFEEGSKEWKEKRYVAIKEYFKEFTVKPTYGYSFHRTLSTYINYVINEGCIIKELVEPQLTEESAKINPEWDRDLHVPSFLVVYAVKA